jgi:catechol 2,3-dioxygenase-like lactoylglutathione lyase family enzyme
MTGIKIEDVAFVAFRAPDLPRMRSFMEDFGASVALQTDDRLFMRGLGDAPFVHMTERGEPSFLMVGLRAESLDDLAKLAVETGTTPAPLDAPGGGQFIDLVDPDGHKVRVVAGQQPAASASGWATACSTSRISAPPRRWYKERFGFITSDEIALSPELSRRRLPALRPGRHAHRPPHPVPDPEPQGSGFQPRRLRSAPTSTI